MMKTFIIVCFLTILLWVKCSNVKPVIRIGNKRIIGKNVDFKGYEVYQFLSIPYAQPPIGQLRFKKPEPISNFPEVLHAVKNPPACHQYTENPFPWYDNSTDKSEDCLYLNIWTPSNASPRNPKAVIFWIYGGGFTYGSIRSRYYCGKPLSAIGDIIVVTVNYRLGPLGFLTSGSREAPGNVGVWDVLEGLKWVNKYIGYFGGDTSRITIAGESAGSIMVGLLAFSPLAKSLFSRQIMESGAPTYLAAENNTQNLASSQELAEKVGCASSTFTIKENPQQVVECLRGVDPAFLVKVDFTRNPRSSSTFLPQYGDEIIPSNPRIAVIKGNFKCKDLFIGNNHDEGSFRLTTENPKTFGFFGEKDPTINKTTGAYYIRKAFKTFNNPESVVQYYLPDSVAEDDYDFIRYQTYTSDGDKQLLCPDVYYAEKCAQKGGKVYYYLFQHRPSNSPWAPWMGVAHFSEVQFVFGLPLLYPSEYTSAEEQISQKMIEIWTSFVREGKPDIPWPQYSREEPFFKFIGPRTITGRGEGPHKKNCDFFRPIFTSLKSVDC